MEYKTDEECLSFDDEKADSACCPIYNDYAAPRCDIDELKKENDKLRAALDKCYEMADTWGACAELPGLIVNICRKTLNGENDDSAN